MGLPRQVKNVLIVCPKRIHVTALESLLKKESCQVTVFERFSEAVKAFQSTPPDMCIVDADFPGTAAYEFCQTIAAHRLQQLILVITGTNPSRETVLMAMQSGAADFIVKPFTINFIGERLNRAARLVLGAESSSPEPGTPVERAQRALRQATSTLALPHAVAKVIQLSSNEKTSAADFAETIRTDPAITLSLLKMANSIQFGGERQVKEIRDAIVRLGDKNVRNAVMAMSIFKLIPGDQKSATFNRFWYWQHSLATALVARMIAEQGKFGDPEDAFLAGLLHDIAKPILDDFARHDFHQVVQTAAKRKVRLCKVEVEVFGLSHAEMGKELLTAWKLPDSLIEAVALHHCGEPSFGPTPKPWEVVEVADRIARSLFIGNSGDFIVEELSAKDVERFRLTALNADGALARKVQEGIADFLEMLGMKLATRVSLPETIGKGGIALWKTPIRPLLAYFLSACGFENAEGKASGQQPVLCVLSESQLEQNQSAASLLEGFNGPVLLLDPSGKAVEGTLAVGSPYHVLSLYHDLMARFAPSKPPEPAAPVEEKKKAKKAASPEDEIVPPKAPEGPPPTAG